MSIRLTFHNYVNLIYKGENMQQLAQLMHVLLCEEPHERDQLKLNDPDDRKCKWYIESNIENLWKQPAHLNWLKKAEMLLEVSGMKDEEKMITLFSQITTIIARLNHIVDDYPQLYEYIMTIVTKSVKPKLKLFEPLEAA